MFPVVLSHGACAFPPMNSIMVKFEWKCDLHSVLEIAVVVTEGRYAGNTADGSIICLVSKKRQ